MTRKKIESPSDLEKLRQEIVAKRDPKKPYITVCSGTGCQAYGSEKWSQHSGKKSKNRS